MRTTTLFRSIGFYLGLLLLCIFAIFAAVWMLITAFKSNTDLYNPTNNPFLFNLPPTLSHIEFLFAQTNYPIFLWNSFLIGVIVVAITLLLAVPAATASRGSWAIGASTRASRSSSSISFRPRFSSFPSMRS